MNKFSFSLLVLLTAFLAGHAVEPSGTLPVLVIETKNSQPIESKSTYVKGTYYLDPRGAEGIEAIGTAENPLPLQIKGRGNFTWYSFSKKPCRLRRVFEGSRMAGLSWTPADQPCEVMLNGDYIGLYFLTETIRFDKKRINLSNPDDAVEDWLEANPGKTAASRPREEAVLRVTHKTPEDYVTDAHRQWLIKEFDEIDRLIYAPDNANGGWLEKIDLTDAARFFVVNQILNNYESYSGSCYLTKDKGEGQKWHFGPVWDFGSAFQATRDQTKWIWESNYIQHWVGNMWNCQAFRDEVKRIFMAMEAEGFDRIFDYQNAYAARIAKAAERDALRWQSEGYGNPDMATPLAEVQKQLSDGINSFGYKLGIEG